MQTNVDRAANDAVDPLSASIRLKVAGGGLLLDGRFDHWYPVALDSRGDGDATVRIIFDATATVTPRRPTSALQDDLFSLRTTSVRRVNNQTYKAKGRLQFGTVQRDLDVLIHTPGGHTPFFYVSLPVDRTAFAELWRDLQDRVKISGVEGEMRARAWLRIPPLAVA